MIELIQKASELPLAERLMTVKAVTIATELNEKSGKEVVTFTDQRYRKWAICILRCDGDIRGYVIISAK